MDKIIHNIITNNLFDVAIVLFFLVVTYYLFQIKTNTLYVIFIVVVTVISVPLGLLNIATATNDDNETLQAFLDFLSVFELPILFLLIDKVFLNNKDKNKDKDIEKQPQQDTSNIKSGTQATKDIVETIEKLQSDIKKIKSKIDNTLQQTIKINDNLTTIETKLDELANLAKLEERAGSTTPENKTTKGNSSNQQS